MILDKIVAHKQEEVAALKASTSIEELEDQITRVEAPRDFRGALRADGISLIAEIKRHSPSKGDILPDLEGVELGALYERTGVNAISILTDQKFFKGSLADLTSVRTNVNIPCLRKEFIIDPIQIYEARAAGADAILLIVRILDAQQLTEYIKLAQALKMAVLVETHSAAEIERAKEAGAHIIGINNRDLDTLEVNVQTTMDLKHHVSGGHVLVSESGIYTRDHVKMLEDSGIDAILVGESLLTSNNISGKIRELLGYDES